LSAADAADGPEPEALNRCNRSVRGHGGISRPFIPVTNAIKALNRQPRKAIKTQVPSGDAACKLIYLALVNAVPRWTWCRNWTVALLAFKIHLATDCLRSHADPDIDNPQLAL
jgi:transposase-like protein